MTQGIPGDESAWQADLAYVKEVEREIRAVEATLPKEAKP